LLTILGLSAILLLDREVGTESPSPIVQARPAPQLKSVEKVTITPPKVKVYAKPAAKKLGIPELPATTSVLTATTLTNDDDRPKTVITTIDEATGDTNTVIKTEPAPWIAADTRGGIRLDYGYKFAPGHPVPRQVVRAQVRQDLFRVKDFHFGGIATIDSTRDVFVGVGVEYRW